MGSIPVWTSSFDSMSLVESGIFGDDWIRQRRRFADRSGDHMASTIFGGDPTRASSRRSLDEEGEAPSLVPKHVRNPPLSPGPLSATLQPEAGRGSPEDGKVDREGESVSMNDEFMTRAVDLSERSVEAGGGPFGAIVVKDEKIVAEGTNRVHTGQRSHGPRGGSSDSERLRSSEHVRSRRLRDLRQLRTVPDVSGGDLLEPDPPRVLREHPGRRGANPIQRRRHLRRILQTPAGAQDRVAGADPLRPSARHPGALEPKPGQDTLLEICDFRREPGPAGDREIFAPGARPGVDIRWPPP